MGDPETFRRRLARLEQLLRDLRVVASRPRRDLLSDRGLQAQAERWLQLAVECALDMAHHVIADHGWQTPTTYRQAFEILHRQGVLGAELTEAMVGWASLRNVLVHLYLDIDYERLYEILTTELDQLEEYARLLAALRD